MIERNWLKNYLNLAFIEPILCGSLSALCVICLPSMGAPWAANEHIIIYCIYKIISEGSCGTEDWSNDTEMAAQLVSYFKL